MNIKLFKQRIGAVLMTMILVGCSTTDTSFDRTLVDNTIDAVLSQEVSQNQYRNHYYSYYLQPDIGRIYANGTGNIFMSGDVEILMNLNVSQIVNSAFYTGTDNSYELRETEIIYERSDSYTDYYDAYHNYRALIYRENEDQVIVQLTTDYTVFYAICSQQEAGYILADMLSIARTVQINQAEILSAYSNKQLITNDRQKVELIQNYAPESGFVEELFNGSVSGDISTGSGTITDGFSTDNFGETIPGYTQEIVEEENPEDETSEEVSETTDSE